MLAISGLQNLVTLDVSYTEFSDLDLDYIVFQTKDLRSFTMYGCYYVTGTSSVVSVVVVAVCVTPPPKFPFCSLITPRPSPRHDMDCQTRGWSRCAPTVPNWKTLLFQTVLL